jgi:neprosin-like protein
VFKLSAPRSPHILTVMAASGALAVGIIAAPGVTSLASAAVRTTSSAAPFVPFRSFIRQTTDARYQALATARAPGARSRRTFDQMRSYILSAYRGAVVRHTFVLGGTYFDCVTVRTQLTVRDRHIKSIATPPPAIKTRGTHPGQLTSPLTQGRTDRYGNAISCPAGTIPMRRITLAGITRFPSLAAFLSKDPPGEKAQVPLPGKTTKPASGIEPEDSGNAHRYAVGYQYVNNWGGNSFLNLWDPEGDFSLSQQWYVATQGPEQTVEGGWIHYPDAFGYNSVLFIYWTSDGYQDGCYNLDCSAFVQVNNSVPLGASFSSYSSFGGAQVGFDLQWQYFQGNWWMAYGGTWVGYFPGSLYGSGELAGGNAQLTEYGGEADAFGDDAWPQMGSGDFPSAGWSYAAFQSDVFYIGQNSPAYYSSLSPIVSNPSCYQLGDTTPDTNIYFGGPGGFSGACD